MDEEEGWRVEVEMVEEVEEKGSGDEHSITGILLEKVQRVKGEQLNVIDYKSFFTEPLNAACLEMGAVK